MTDQGDAIRKFRQEELEKAYEEGTAGEDPHFPESFRKLWRNLLRTGKRR